jgi:hypothetical protein
MEEADECAMLRLEPDSVSSLHALVVADHQPVEKLIDFTTDNTIIYTSPTGCMIALGLAYNLHHGFIVFFSNRRNLSQYQRHWYHKFKSSK